MSPTKRMLALASLLLLAAAGLAVAALCRNPPPATPDQPRGDADDTSPVEKRPIKEMTAELRALVNSNSDFALDLYARLAGDKQGKNLFFSPYSLSSALAMVVEGARGETADQMGKALHYADTLRRAGDEARTLPWDTARLHTGMAALNDHVASGSATAPKQVRDRLDALRKQLQSANQEAAERARKRQWDAQMAAATKSQKIAAELNRLQSEYGQYELRIANALWGEKTYPFKQSYLDTLHKHYRTGGLFPVDFRNDFEGARQRINAWVEKQTRERIKDMIPENVLDEEGKKLLRLVLTNAIYFKGEWAEVFSEGQTKDDDFLLAGGAKVRVPTMRRGDMPGVRYAAFRGDGTFFDTPGRVPLGEIDPKTVYPDERGFTLLEMPYKGGEVSMVVLVPRSADGLAALEKKLTSANLQTWVGKLQQRSVHVFLPKFKLETEYKLEKTLQEMGMVRAFLDPRLPKGAQFDGMRDSEDPS